MIRTRLSAAMLCAAMALALAQPLHAAAADAPPAAKAPTSPEQPAPRGGAYRIVSRGDKVIHAKCTEGGNVIVPTRKAATAAQRDRAIRDACKTVDYSK